ncbi:MAG: molybdenum cofactor biosynthesis protein MoaE [Hyphomicrobiales bacterium]|jgi:molybdopterin synthase catalytic subunit|nr:molybdenum cofactor biosynthesis protein MoaE [Hyphomicrobiales bacterium]|tara:strand:+ start:757 stop:1203 length:447 start_codon:yes stop_codon:yes gene_type:complete
MHIEVKEDDFIIENEIVAIENIKDPDAAISIFVGKVRKEKKLIKLFIDCYPEMAENEIQKIVQNASNRWKLNQVRIIHRYGSLDPGENIVLVITTSDHRGDCYSANQFIMDFLKSEAAFWKKEIFLDKTKWVEQKVTDISTMKDWQED